MLAARLPAKSKLELAVLGELASGGMGRVDLARIAGGGAPGDPREATGNVVAVKRLHPHLARDAHFVRMFLDEAWMTGALRHENVAELVAWGEDSEGMFLAMEFVYGAPLSHVARAGLIEGEPMPLALIAFVGAKVAAGLHAAHELRGEDGVSLGLVHRDVTPSNVLLGFDGTVKVTDFGVATAAGKNTHTATGVLKGKVAYMSPEYAGAKGIDRRSDVYSLGVVLYELATGDRPFSAGHDLDLLRKIVEAPVPKIAQLVPGFDPDLAALIEQLLAKRPAERPSDGLLVKRALDAWFSERGFSADRVRDDLAAYVERYADDRKAEIARLLEREEPRRPARMKTRPSTAAAVAPPEHDPTEDTTDRLPPPEDDVGARPHTRPLAVGHLAARSSSPELGAGVAVPRAAMPSGPDIPMPSDRSRTLPLSALPGFKPPSPSPPLSADDATTTIPIHELHAARRALADSTHAGVSSSNIAAPRPRISPQARRLGLVGAGTFVAASVLLTLAILATRPRPVDATAETVAPAAVTVTTGAPPVPTAVATVAPSPPGPDVTADPPREASSARPSDTSRSPEPRAPKTAAPHVVKPPPAKTAAPRSCTPADFDYPGCLGKKP